MSVRFSGEQKIVVKQNGRIMFEGTSHIKYSFIDSQYSMLFHQDLRARKNILHVSVARIHSAKLLEARKEVVYLWKDTINTEVQLHTLSYFSSEVEHQEVEFPLLWFHNEVKKEGAKTLLLSFMLAEGDTNVSRRRSQPSSTLSRGMYCFLS
jgi:hypothetical protein